MILAYKLHEYTDNQQVKKLVAQCDSSYYSYLFFQSRKLKRKVSKFDLYYFHNNQLIHTSVVSSATIEDCGLNVILHPPLSLYLAPSDF